MIRKSWVVCTIFFALLVQIADCQTQIIKNNFQIRWKNPLIYTINDDEKRVLLNFDGAVSGTEFSTLPYFMERIKVDNFYTDYDYTFSNIEYTSLTSEEVNLIPVDYSYTELKATVKTVSEKKQPYTIITFVPIVKRGNGSYAKVTSFDLVVTAKSSVTKVRTKGGDNYAAHSVLQQGGWYRVAIPKSGIYKVTFEDLKKWGALSSGIASNRIAVHGNGGRLPEICGERSYDDLPENAIAVYDGGDGIFNSGDYFLFYAQDPHTWSNAGNRFSHQYNIYTDYAYYFISVDANSGKRISPVDNSSLVDNKQVTDYTYYDFYERDGFIFGESGQSWYCDTFDLRNTRSYKFTIPPIVPSTSMRVSVSGAVSSVSTSYFQVSMNGQSVGNVNFKSSAGEYLAMQGSADLRFTPSSTPSELTLTYSKPTSSSSAYLDWIELQGTCQLTMHSAQFPFCNIENTGNGNVLDYHIASANAQTHVWDITDPTRPFELTGNLSNGTFSFKSKADSLHLFVAFNGTSFYTPTFVEKVSNQDLHATNNVDMIIVSHPDFISQAERLAEFRHQNDGLTVKVVTPQQVYNEFSSGACDVSAIRDYMKMMYERSNGQYPKYLLLFGRPSYDYRGHVAGTQMKVPNYQSNSRLIETDFRSNDDYFGLLDDGEGEDCSGLVDIAIGRFPVLTTSQAKIAVDKTILYAQTHNLANSKDNSIISNLADWRNVMAFTADDEDGSTHISTADEIAQIVAEKAPGINEDKIYLDAYEQVSHSAAQRYPDVNTAINSRMKKGSLVFAYVGHGGKDGWATERIIERSDINSWTNLYNQPLMITLTCEFGWYDRVATSPAELCFLNAKGGTSAMVTTSRVAFTYNNDQYGKAFFRNMFDKENGQYRSIGELNRLAKNNCGGAGSGLNMIYVMGDPSQRLAFPQYSIVTDSINGKAATSKLDTIRALSQVTVKGHITNGDGTVMTNFNGNLFPSVYDKKQRVTTLQNDEGSDAYEFDVQKNLLFKGNASVKNGYFEFSFFVPKDIDYSYGNGKISYYARSENADAAGYFDQMTIGGISDVAIDDKTGPEIEIYMNDESFVAGGTTDPNPTLLVKLKDNYGINTTGNGLGHDLVAVLDNSTDKQFVLNDFYEASQDSANQGEVRYALEKLTVGNHSIKVRAWDILNNVSESTLDFVVFSDAKLALEHVLNYPNPFTTHTSFFFEHNQPGSTFDIIIQIFTISGKLVKTIETSQQLNGYRCDPIEWDGRDDFGDKIGKGVYVYKLKVRNQDGEKAEKIEKVVIL